MHSLWGHVGDVGDELLQVPAGLLQVGGVDNDLDKLKGRYEHVKTLKDIQGLPLHQS